MARPTAQQRLSIAKGDMVRHFDNLSNNIFDLRSLTEILHDKREFWRLGNISRNTFIDFLSTKSKLDKKVFEFPNRNTIRYTWGDVPEYELILALKPASYFSHYSAMYLHNLTEQVPKTIYVNYEQTPKPRSDAELSQERIDYAFRCKTRLSNTVAQYQDRSIRVLNGMHAGQLGVVETEGPDGSRIRLTNVERTLVDIAVRPEYSGGPVEVLSAYRKAASRVSVNKLTAFLKRLDFVYPFNQVIGFYLERSGCYTESQIALLRKFGVRFDFYLMHQMKDPRYSEKWRLYYPDGLG